MVKAASVAVVVERDMVRAMILTLFCLHMVQLYSLCPSVIALITHHDSQLG